MDPLDPPRAASTPWIPWTVADLQDADPFRVLQHCLGDVRFTALVAWMNTAGRRLLRPLVEGPGPIPLPMGPVEHAKATVRRAIDVIVDLLGTALTNPGTRLSLRPRQDQDDQAVMRAAAAVEQAIQTFYANGLPTKPLRDALNNIIIASRTPFIRPDDIDAVIEQVHGPQPKQGGKGDPLRFVFQVGRVFQVLTTGTCIPNVDWELIPVSARAAVTCGICGAPIKQAHGQVADKDARFLLAELLKAIGIAPEPKRKAARYATPTPTPPSSTDHSEWKDSAIKRLLGRFRDDYLTG